MKLRLLTALCLTATVGLASIVSAAELGDPAAPLHISDWVKGKPVKLADLKDKQIAVVEFWATWCPPCRESIPHLTKLQKQFKDVVFIGVSDEDSATVKKFVVKMGDQMDYTVAVDEDEKTADGYMKAFGINGIPHAFIVNKEGKIVWSGHPMDHLDQALEEIQSGKYDLEKAKKRSVAREKLDQFLELASTDDQNPQLDKLGAEIEALDREVGGIEPGQKFDAAKVRKMIRYQKAINDYQRSVVAGASQETLDKLGQQVAAVAPEDFNLADFKEDMATRQKFMEYYKAVVSGADKDKTAKLAQELSQMKSKNGAAMDQMAWAILTDDQIQDRDIPLALKLAKAAVDASKAKEPSALDTYARALFDSGNAREAAAWQRKAVAAATSDEMRGDLEASLKKYEDEAAK